MDEAERCHQLAILADGKLVAQGVPLQLMADIAARVVEVTAEDTVAARRALLEDPAVLSVAQLGTRLHVLLDPATTNAAERCAERLRTAGVCSARAGRRPRASRTSSSPSTGFRRTSHVDAREG